MTAIIISFPPGAGGNHLKNIISADISFLKELDLYKHKTVHKVPGGNLKKQQVDYAVNNPCLLNFLHGHFGEIMSYQYQIRDIVDKKFIIICPDTAEDHELLRTRQQRLGFSYYPRSGEYFEGEQVFLYEPFMYHHYFNVPMENIMNIPITEWFVEDISPVVHRLNFFLKTNLDVDSVNEMHRIWYRNNFK